MFDFELERVSNWIKDGGFSSVTLQFPEGLKIRAPEIADFLSDSTGAEIIISGHPCYGACDLFDYKGVSEALVHFGHSRIPSLGDDPNVLYVESRSDAEIGGDIASLLDFLPENVGILASIQYIGLSPAVKEHLEKTGRKVFVGTGDRRICYPGQVLGCNCTAAESVKDLSDAFLFIGEGDFHPLAVSLGTEKPVYLLNPLTSEVTCLSEKRDRILRRRFAAIQSASGAETVIVIECSKTGQNRAGEADRIVSLARSKGKKEFKVIMEEITPDSLAAFRAGAFVNTACPRISLDDSARYSRPVLTVPEAEILFGEREWKDYVFDQIRSRSLRSGI